MMLTQHVFKEAEQSRFFWQHKISLEVKQVLEMSAETVRNLKSVQLQVQQLEDLLQKHVASSEGVPQLPPEMQHPPPRPAPRDDSIVDLDSHKQVMQAMLSDTVRRSSSTIADRLEELHDRLDEVRVSNTQRLEEVLQDTASSREQWDRLEALLSVRHEESIFISPQGAPRQPSQATYAQQPVAVGAVLSSRMAEDAVPSNDPLVEFGKVRQNDTMKNDMVKTKSSRKSAFESLGSINKLQLSRELFTGEDGEDERGDRKSVV